MNHHVITTYAINELPPEIQERVRQDWKNSIQWQGQLHRMVKTACETRIAEWGYCHTNSLFWYTPTLAFYGPIPDVRLLIHRLYEDRTAQQVLLDWLDGIDASKFQAEIKAVSVGAYHHNLLAEIVYDGDLSRDMEQRLRELAIRINLDVVALQADLETLAAELETELGRDAVIDADLLAQEIEFTADGNQFFYNKEGVS